MRNKDKSKKILVLLVVLVVLAVATYILSADIEVKTEHIRKDITAEVIK